MKTRKAFIQLATLLASLALTASADVTIPDLFSSGAVLQQGKPVPVWGTANKGEKVTVSIQGQTVETVAGEDGNWRVKLQSLKPGGPFTLTVKGANTITVDGILVGEVWLCSGQSNMGFTLARAHNAAEAIAQANDPELKLFEVPRAATDTPKASVSGQWKPTTPMNASNFSAVAYFFGRDLRKHLKVPVGLIWSAVGGTPAEAWTPRETLAADHELNKLLESHEAAVKGYDPSKAKVARENALKRHKTAVAKAKAEGKPIPAAPRAQADPGSSQRRPTGLYNAMIAPLCPYTIAGVIWYQGEANSGRAAEYQRLFPAMIGSWRQKWGQGDFPFLFVQIAPHERMTPEIREAQLLTWKNTPKTAMIVTTDVGDATDIHPTRKEPVGARLALAARALAYNEPIEYMGPVYESMKVQADQVILTFSHAGSGLVSKGGTLQGFTISGESGQFTAANAEIDGDKIIISSEAVQIPKAVRYGWSNVPEVNLFNKEGLPASPFRTDQEK